MNAFLSLVIGLVIDLLIYKFFGFEIAVIWGLACISNTIYWSNK